VKIIEHPGDAEREVIIGMIVNDTVAGRVAAIWGDGPGPFSCPSWNLVGKWCVDHHNSYGVAINKGVQSHFREWADGRDDHPETVKIGALLDSLSDQYKRLKREINPDYITDLATRTFRAVKLARLTQEVTEHLEAKKLDDAEACVAKYSTVNLAASVGVEPYILPETVESTFAYESRDPLIRYPDGLGEFFGHLLGRDQFVAFMGSEKSGKSWILLDIAYTAMLDRRRVLYFQVGDLSERQIKERFIVRAARHPTMSTSEDGVSWPCSVRIPTEIEAPGPGDDHANVKFSTKRFDAPYQSKPGYGKELCDYIRGKLKSKRAYLRLFCYPTNSISVLGIKSVVEANVLSGYVPDVICIDYADILSPINHRSEPLHQIKKTWEELRKLSQVYHCLVVTATQVNAAAYGKKTLDRSNFSGNHLKYAEVTAMFAINMTADEKESQIMRLNCIARREGHNNINRCVHVAGCLALSSPFMVSVYPRWGGKKKPTE